MNIGRDIENDRNARTDRLPQKVGEVRNELCNFDCFELQFLASRECQQTPCQVCAALGALNGPVNQSRRAGIFGQTLPQKRQAA